MTAKARDRCNRWRSVTVSFRMSPEENERLHYEDRQTIEAMSKQGSSVSDIAEVLGTHRDTIYREFKRCNATLKTYTAAAGQQAL